MAEEDVTGEGAEPRTCPWCSAPVPDGATRCPRCDAAVAQRESLGDLVIPGVTGVDPAMQSERSVLQGVMHVQAVSSRAAMAASPFPVIGPPGLENLVQAAFLGPEMLGAARLAGNLMSVGSGDVDVSHVGEPSELARLAAEQLDAQEAAGQDGTRNTAGDNAASDNAARENARGNDAVGGDAAWNAGGGDSSGVSATPIPSAGESELERR